MLIHMEMAFLNHCIQYQKFGVIEFAGNRKQPMEGKSKWISDGESSTSTISTKAMKNIIENLKVQRHRSSTQANYYAIWKMFNQFFVKLDVKPKTWEERLILVVGYLVHKQLKANTINSYVEWVC